DAPAVDVRSLASARPIHSLRGLLPIAVLAFVTACCMAAVRIWPVMRGLMFEQCVVNSQLGFGTSGDHGYLALTGFVPEIMGLHYIDAARIGKALGNTGRHTQFHNLPYYGIVPVLLVWLSVLRGLGPRSFGMAAIYLCVALTPLFLLQPISDLVNIVVWPLHHDIMCRTGGAFLLCAALVPILVELRETGVGP